MIINLESTSTIYKVVLFQDTSESSVDHLSAGLERYKHLQKYFNRRLKATYHQFSSIPDHSMVRPAFCFLYLNHFIRNMNITSVEKTFEFQEVNESCLEDSNVSHVAASKFRNLSKYQFTFQCDFS